MTTYRLARPAHGAVTTPTLDAAQQAVVDHPGGPLLVLAGPGTGKTTTLVEAIVDRIDRRGARPDEVLALTFSRKAAEQLRDRVIARLGRTISSPISSTFHSFAYGLVREFSPAEVYAEPLRVLSSPEADVILRDLLTSPEAPTVAWPASLAAAVGTRGFAREVYDVMSRAREKGMDAADLIALGREHNIVEYAAAGAFLEQYLTILDSHAALDHPDIMRRGVIEAADHRDVLRKRYSWVFVDEYQDTDPGQVALLRQLAGDGANLVAVGDPHQSIYGFRGAEVRGILDFPAQFPTRSGAPADVIALTGTRRFGPEILTAVGRIAERLGLPPSLPPAARAAFASPVCVDEGAVGEVDVMTFDNDRSEAEHIADLLRRAHLRDGISWSQMAVLVRSGRTTIPSLRRALVGAGVPVEVAVDDTPLGAEPAVMTLVEGLRAALNLTNDDPESPGFLDPARVEGLMMSPLAGLDAADVRALAQALRRHEKATCVESGETPRSSADLLRAALVDPTLTQALDIHALDTRANTPISTAVARARALASLLWQTHDLAAQGSAADEVVWHLWQGTSWPQRLQAAAESGGSAARLAHRDLDAVCALFEYAARTQARRDRTTASEFLELLVAQQIPSDSLAERGVRGDAVRLLTAHRSKGLEWDLVVVAHVQEDAWPSVRQRSGLLKAEQIGARTLVPARSRRELIAEDRRLFYVACTRARQRLIVTAVQSEDDEGERASRFLAELCGPVLTPALPTTALVGRPTRPLSLVGVVAQLRRAVADPGTSPALRAASGRRLMALAQEQVRGRWVAPAADPARWWGVSERTVSPVALRPHEAPLALSASTVEAVLTCPARWFLQREAGGDSRTTQASGFGSIVHAVAAAVVARDTVPTLDEVMVGVDRVWDQLSFRTPWARRQQRAQIRDVLARFLAWHSRPGARAVIAVEHQFAVVSTLPDGREVILRGAMDRLELDADGAVVVVDLKTSKAAPTAKSIPDNPQLGLYQQAVASGAADGLVDAASTPVTPGGAELLQLRAVKTNEALTQHQPAQEPDGEGWTTSQRQVGAVAELIRAEELVAIPGDHCRYCDFEAMCPAKQSATVLS